MKSTLVLLALLGSLAASPALADLEFCNSTDENVSVAIGYSEDGTWVSEGWWTMAPGGCTRAIVGDLSKRYYYWRATSPSYTWENGSYIFCTSPSEFTIVGDEDCADRGYDQHPFNVVDTGEAASYTVTLTVGGPEVPDRDRPMTGGTGQ